MGALSLGEKSGYDLKKDFEHRMGHFWAESLGQIYPTLHRLHREKLVVVRRGGAEGRPERKLYRLTAAGRKALKSWLLEEPERESVRNELLLKLFFGPEMGTETALRHLESLQERLLRRQRVFGGMTQEIESLPVSQEQRAYWHLTLDAGQELCEARLRWCRKSLDRLRKMQASNTSNG